MMDASTAMLGVVYDPTLHQSGSTVIGALERAYGAVRDQYPILPDAVIITGSGLTGYGLKWGHFAYDQWSDAVSQGRRPELFIGGERLSTGPELTMQTLLHECAHALAHARGVQDTSRGHRYHNRRFVAIAEELGLAYQHEGPDSVIGFSAVTLTPAGMARWSREIAGIRKATTLSIGVPGIFGGAPLPPGLGGGGHGTTTVRRGKGTGGSSYVKAVCQCPRTIRVAKSVLAEGPILCGQCGAEFLA